MNKPYPFTEIQEKIASSQKIYIVLPQNPLFDNVSAALSLYLPLKDAGKTISVLSTSPMTVDVNRLVGVDQIGTSAKGTDLVITLDYSMENIEKVSYNDEQGKLNLVIQPKVGGPALTEKLVNFSYAGLGADLIFSVGIKNPELMSLPKDIDLSQTSMVNIDNNPENTQYGDFNVIDNSASSLSEMVLGLLIGLNFPVNSDIAQNILSGIWRNTHGLSGSQIEADTYEAVAICLRAGAKRPVENVQPKVNSIENKSNRPWQQNQMNRNTTNIQEPKTEKQGDWFEPKVYKNTNVA